MNNQHLEVIAMETSNEILVKNFVDEKVSRYNVKMEELDAWHCPHLHISHFIKILFSSANAIMARRGEKREFKVDDYNRDVIKQMFLYVVGAKECQWDINKGIYLGGKIGCGKTVLIQAFCEVLSFITRKHIEMIPAYKLHEQIIKNGLEYYATRPLIIDELGREPLEVNEFGNRLKPINSLIEMRYETGAKTFFTSNFKLETLAYGSKNGREGYGEYIGERIKAMANIVILPGDSRRDKLDERK